MPLLPPLTSTVLPDFIAGAPVFGVPAPAAPIIIAMPDFTAGAPLFGAPTPGAGGGNILPDFVASAPVFGAPAMGAGAGNSLPDFTLGTPTFGAPTITVFGEPARDESLFIRIDAPLREVVSIRAPLAS